MTLCFVLSQWQVHMGTSVMK